MDSVQKTTASLSYLLARNEFERLATQTFVIKDEQLELTVKKPDQVLSGSILEVTIHYNNNSDFDFKQLNLRANYPSSFKFLSAELEPDSLNNFWRLGTLRSGSSGELKIRGLWESIDGGSSDFEAVLFVEFLGHCVFFFCVCYVGQIMMWLNMTLAVVSFLYDDKKRSRRIVIHETTHPRRQKNKT